MNNTKIVDLHEEIIEKEKELIELEEKKEELEELKSEFKQLANSEETTEVTRKDPEKADTSSGSDLDKAKCVICESEFKDRRGMGAHLSHVHGITGDGVGKKYDANYEDSSPLEGPIEEVQNRVAHFLDRKEEKMYFKEIAKEFFGKEIESGTSEYVKVLTLLKEADNVESEKSGRRRLFWANVPE